MRRIFISICALFVTIMVCQAGEKCVRPPASFMSLSGCSAQLALDGVGSVDWIAVCGDIKFLGVGLCGNAGASVGTTLDSLPRNDSNYMRGCWCKTIAPFESPWVATGANANDQGWANCTQNCSNLCVKQILTPSSPVAGILFSTVLNR